MSNGRARGVVPLFDCLQGISWHCSENLKWYLLTTSFRFQFRAINDEKSAFALCPGVKFTTTRGNVEHACVGGTSFHDGHTNIEKYCGDFAAKDWDDHSGTATQSSASKDIIESVIMIFYR